jgi:hypothetical protein
MSGTDPDLLRNLYGVIAKILGSGVPDVDFSHFAAEIEPLEQEYRNAPQLSDSLQCEIDRHESITDPRVLCITNSQLLTLSHPNELETIRKAFPEPVAHSCALTPAEVTESLSQHFDIVHIATAVCPKTDDLLSVITRARLALVRNMRGTF